MKKYFYFFMFLFLVLSASLNAFQLSADKTYIIMPTPTEVVKLKAIFGVVETPVPEPDTTLLLFTPITPFTLTRYSQEKGGKWSNHNDVSAGLAYVFMVANQTPALAKLNNVEPLFVFGPTFALGFIETPVNSKQYELTYRAGITAGINIDQVPLNVEWGYDFVNYKFLLAIGVKFDVATLGDILTAKWMVFNK
jgi:hypothetical protein